MELVLRRHLLHHIIIIVTTSTIQGWVIRTLIGGQGDPHSPDDTSVGDLAPGWVDVSSLFTWDLMVLIICIYSPLGMITYKTIWEHIVKLITISVI